MEEQLTREGHVVLSLCIYGQIEGEDKGLPTVTSEMKQQLRKIHLKKIELADEIFVLNKDGYIGEDTNAEIAYATKLGKRVTYLEYEVTQRPHRKVF
jgi:hypothetical protein